MPHHAVSFPTTTNDLQGPLTVAKLSKCNPIFSGFQPTERVARTIHSPDWFSSHTGSLQLLDYVADDTLVASGSTSSGTGARMSWLVVD